MFEKLISPETGITWPVAAFLLVNCALGAGVLNYPAAYDRLGGIFIATIIQLVSYWYFIRASHPLNCSTVHDGRFSRKHDHLGLLF